jgi:N-hydroxyarylamine O-acetyltransferase
MARATALDDLAYLDRLGLEPEAPSVDALHRLHRAHVERVPWETLWIQLGERWGTDVRESSARIANSTRGGYCFHLNGAFSALLRGLGYQVTLHVGGVHGPVGPAPADLTNHLAVMVADLPSEANPGGRWYVDVGLGDALYDPIPLRSGHYRQDPFDLALDPVDTGLGDWHLTHGEGGSFSGMSWSATPIQMNTFDRRHEWLSSDPDSGFVRTLVVQRRDAGSVVVLRGRTLRRIGAGACETVLATGAELFEVLADLFGIDISDIDDVRRTALWHRVCAHSLGPSA